MHTIGIKLFRWELRKYVSPVVAIICTVKAGPPPDSVTNHTHLSVQSSGFSGSLRISLTIVSVSPTCLRVLTSRLRSRNRIAAGFSVNPWVLPLMTADCYCKGSEDEDKRFR